MYSLGISWQHRPLQAGIGTNRVNYTFGCCSAEHPPSGDPLDFDRALLTFDEKAAGVRGTQLL
jgi:hypothetical protein